MSRGTALLSPHPDDAAFSLGGALLRKFFPQPVTVVTLFGRSAYSKQEGFSGDPERVSRLRHQEEQAATARLGVRLLYFELPEAALRGEPLFASPVDEPLAPPESLLEALDEALQPPLPQLLLLPLGLGRHRDHLLVRQAASTLARRQRLTYAYYEDLPYAAWVSRWGLRRHLRSVEPGLTPEVIPLGPHRRAKVEVLRLYRSQVGRRELLAVAWHQLWVRRSAERIWRP